MLKKSLPEKKSRNTFKQKLPADEGWFWEIGRQIAIYYYFNSSVSGINMSQFNSAAHTFHGDNSIS